MTPQPWNRAGWILLAATLLFPPLLQAESTLIFPRVSFEPDVLTGLALVNPTSQQAVVTLTAYGTDGQPLSGTGVTNPAKITVPANQQAAKLTYELFGRSIDPATIAWVQGTSPVNEVTGFFLFLNSSVTVMDGADLPTATQKAVFNLVRVDSGYSTELNIVNPGDKAANAQLQLAGSGLTPVSKPLSIPAKGMVRADVATLFDSADIPTAAYIIVDSDVELAGFELIKSPSGDGVGLNARRGADRLTSLYFLQLSVLGPNKTQLGVVNYSDVPVILTISAYKPDGSLYDAAYLKNNPVTRTLVVGGSLREDVASMFGFSGTQSLDGWLLVRSTSDAINGYITCANASTGAAAAVASSAQGPTRAIFSHIAAASPFSTGLSLLNSGTLASNVRVLALKPTGEILGTFDTVLQPNQRFNKSVGTADLLPEAAGQTGGFLWVKSDLPIYMSCLIGSDKSSANIPPQDTPDSYNPDTGVPALKLKPSLAIVPPGTSQRFQIEGSISNPVWKVNGVAGGSASTGTVSTSGVFTAPRSVPARQVVTITAESTKQAAGASADVLDKQPYSSDLKVLQSVAYLDLLGKTYAAELSALASPMIDQQSGPSAAAGASSQILELSPLGIKVQIAVYNNENIIKIIAFKASNGRQYLLLAAQTTGRIIRLDPTTKQSRDVATGLNEPSSMVIDPASGDLLVAEKDKVSTIPKSALESDLASAADGAPGGSALVGRSGGIGRPLFITAGGATGIAVDRCTGKIYYSIGTAGTIVEYDPATNGSRTIASGLQNPGQLLAIYRDGVACPDSFHLLAAERGANRIILVIPSSGSISEWLASAGINDLAFIPSGSRDAPGGGILVADYTLQNNGSVFLVPLGNLYGDTPPNPPETSLEDVKTDLSIVQAASPNPASPGYVVTFTLTVANRGPNSATLVTVTNTLPADVTFLSAEASKGSCSQTGSTVNCLLGGLAVNQTVVITIRLTPNYSGSASARRMENRATVSSLEIDPDRSNNTAAASVVVLPAAGTKLEVTALADPMGAGNSTSVTVTAKDDFGNVAIGYVGTIRFTATDTAATLPANYTFVPGDNGRHTFSNAVRLRTAGNQTVTAQDVDNTSINGSQTVLVNPAALAALQITPGSGTVTAGSVLNLTVTATDTFGNRINNVSLRTHFTSSDASATLPADYTFVPADNGSHAFPVTLKTAGSQTVTVTATSPASMGAAPGDRLFLSISGTATFMVNPAAASILQLSGMASPTTAGSQTSVTVTAKDPYGNTATGYAGTIRFTSTDTQATLPANYTYVAADNGLHAFTNAVVLKTAGNQTVTATDTSTSTITGNQSVMVNPGATTSLQVSGISNPSTAGVPSDVTVAAKDPFGNTTPAYIGTIRFTSSDAKASVPGNYTFVPADSGSHTFAAGVILRSPGSQSVTAADTTTSTITGSQTVTVNPGPAASLQVTGIANPSSAGVSSNLTVTALDAGGNTATSYRGTVHFTSTDSGATLPADHVFVAADNGTHTFVNGVTLRGTGSQTVTATDTATATITGSQTVTVVPSQPVTLQVTGLSNPTTAGTPANVTVAAKDATGNTVTNYRGTVAFTSTDASATLPSDYTFVAADNGSHTFVSGVTLKTAGDQSVTVIDTATPTLKGSQSVTVNPAPISWLYVSDMPDPFLAGSSSNITVIAKDPYWNHITNYTGTIRFTSTDTAATLPANYSFVAADSGVHTFKNGVTLRTPGSQTVTVTDTALPSIHGQQTVNVTTSTAATVNITGIPSSLTAGVPSDVTVTIKDISGNTVTTYTGTVVFTSTDPQAILPPNYTFVTLDAGTHRFPLGVNLRTAGSRQVTVTDSAVPSLSGTQTVTVTPGATTLLNVTGITSPISAGAPSNVTVAARDQFGNLTPGYRGTIRFTSTDSAATLPANYTFLAGDNGSHTFVDGVVFRTTGSQTVSATDTVSTTITGSQTVTVGAGPASSLQITGVSSPTTAGSSGNITVTAKDALGNTATGYRGTIHFASSDTTATLPADYIFAAVDNGSHTFVSSLVLKTAGSQSVSVNDTGSPAINGSTNVTVLPGPAASLILSVTASSVVAGVPQTVAVTARDQFNNTATV